MIQVPLNMLLGGFVVSLLKGLIMEVTFIIVLLSLIVISLNWNRFKKEEPPKKRKKLRYDEDGRRLPQ